MKTRHLIILLALAACQPVEIEFKIRPQEDGLEQQNPADSLATLTLEASKGADQGDTGGQTKALDLVSGTPDRLDAYWKNTERVPVFKGDEMLGMLFVAPAEGVKPTSATLSGAITTTDLHENDNLMLMIPRDSWDYTGQPGTLASIETNYDYAVAAVTVDTIDGSLITTTTGASFANQQSIYRFGFKVGGEYIDPKEFQVSASGGQLVQSVSYEGGAWTPLFGPLTVTPASAPGDHFYYVAIRNDHTSDDTYTFTITGSDDALYMASKAIPGSVLDAPGKFISAKNITATQPRFSPSAATTTIAL